MQPKIVKFSNGLNLILHPMSSVQSVAVYVAVGAGPRYETKETAGLAHFLEHMLFEGTKRFPTARQISEYIECVGGTGSAWTDKESVTYYAKVPKQHLELAFDYLFDILFNSLLNGNEIEKEKRLIIEELNRSKDNPQDATWDPWLELVFGKNQSLGRSTLGDKRTILNISKQKLQAYLERFYHPANMVIAVVGNFSIKHAKSYTIKYFGKMQKKEVVKFKNAKFIPKKIHTQIFNVNTKQCQLVLGFFTGISAKHKDRFSMRVIVDILSSGVSSRIFHKLVYDEGIAYSVGAQSWVFSDTGIFYVFGGFAKENVEKAIILILSELNKLKIEKISDKEVAAAKEKDKASFYFSLETPDAIASYYASSQLLDKKIMTAEDVSEKIDNVTAEDIQRTARKYFVTKNLLLAIRGPFDENNLSRIEDICINRLK